MNVRIETARAELNEQAEHFGIDGIEVLRKSQELDELLNIYHRSSQIGKDSVNFHR